LSPVAAAVILLVKDSNQADCSLLRKRYLPASRKSISSSPVQPYWYACPYCCSSTFSFSSSVHSVLDC